MSDERVQLSTREANLRRSERSIAYSYVRVSSAQQDLRGETEGQIQTLAEYAQRGRIIADKYYADRAVSLWEGNGQIPGEQKALKQLQDDILKEPNPRKFIFATKVSRFARNRKKGKLFFDWVMKNGITIQVLDEIFTPDELSASNWFDLCVEAEEEDQTLSKNAQEAHQRLRETSQLSGRLPWGFENYQGERRIKQDAVALVQSLYEEVRKGESIEEVSRNHSPSPQMKTSGAYRSAQKKRCERFSIILPLLGSMRPLYRLVQFALTKHHGSQRLAHTIFFKCNCYFHGVLWDTRETVSILMAG